jgi:hypothetical protein
MNRYVKTKIVTTEDGVHCHTDCQFFDCGGCWLFPIPVDRNFCFGSYPKMGRSIKLEIDRKSEGCSLFFRCRDCNGTEIE